MCKCNPSIRTLYCGKTGCEAPPRYKSIAAPPTPQEQEILQIIIEECAEVQQRATKALRFGPREVQAGQELDNVKRMSHEIGELLEMLRIARGRGLIDMEQIKAGKTHKRRQLAKYAQSFDMELTWLERAEYV